MRRGAIAWHGRQGQRASDGTLHLNARREWGKSGVKPSSGGLFIFSSTYTPVGKGEWGHGDRTQTGGARPRSEANVIRTKSCMGPHPQSPINEGMNVCCCVLCVSSCSNRWRLRSPGGCCSGLYDTDLSWMFLKRTPVCLFSFCVVWPLLVCSVKRLGGGARGGEDEWEEALARGEEGWGRMGCERRRRKGPRLFR